ncbi:DNA polymerase III, subunits gamma and tau [Ruminiclostridium papyrosolvens DSM 2782]|uniref:DNA-directed DNA polymerase n=1 Tax=Ruminiclostridium papyrosolvens DSM 2782 TaxID=588581 RepID=F1TE75_9FIRM|nr:DNA polymerase III subunit gamma/tau [Ruminiclostridium papyrosolvens]EGD47315.1 DNA polymerase III, subunits gamma and tau [Ruminiclostridium papyrosolvens DSM 2782]WES34662.1 DNA polymerase III subunit gamma/tau [Ruminiclostridium papyrosolvens DSM 2782]
MSYTALYRKWRPLVFEDVVEQEHVVRTIKNTVKSGRVAHAYLFCGTRGTGKTTMAKIFARAINCLNPKDGDPCNECEVCRGILDESILDVVEIDAASNNSVDNVREIREEVVYAPSQARYKVYIIDEVHMLSSGAFNALLKTLEEPPGHVVFILATTDPHKLPATILSRCQRFDFKKITPAGIAERVKVIARASGIQLDDDGALLIARLADGALRDALSILDQCIAEGNNNITHENVLDAIGIVSDDFISEIVDNIQSKNVEGLVADVEKLSASGRDILRFASDLVLYFRNLLICKLSKNPENILDMGNQYLDKMILQSEVFSKEQLIGIIKELSSFETQLKYALNQRVFLEVMLISISVGSYGRSGSDNNLADRIANLESAVRTGNVALAGSVKDGSGIPVQTKPESSSSVSAGKKFDNLPPVSGSSAPKASAKGKSYNELEEWSNVLSDLKANRRMMLLSYLTSTKAVAADESTVLVVFPPAAISLKEIVSKAEHIDVLENALESRLGRRIRVKVVDEESLESMVQSEPSSAKNSEENPLVKLTREISDRLNVPLDIIDE